MVDVIVASGDVASGRLTLVPNQVSTVTFRANVQTVQVWHNGTVPVYVTTDGRPPSLDGQHCYEVPPGLLGEYATPDVSQGDVVKLLCAEAETVRVERA